MKQTAGPRFGAGAAMGNDTRTGRPVACNVERVMWMPFAVVEKARLCIAAFAVLAGAAVGAAHAQSAKGAPVVEAAAAAAGDARTSARIFYSGHSLTDNPLPEDVAEIARSLGGSARWNQQNIPGSSIQKRTRGDGHWAGYRQGKNREGSGMDVVAELRQPKTLGGDRYDTLLVTEGHWLVDSLLTADTVRSLRHLHERALEGNPQTRTFFYHPWLGFDDKSDLREWLAYERQAAPVWACVGARINHSLAAEGRADRIVPLPASMALVTLLERATAPGGVAGISGAGTRETVDRLVADDVHLTRLGVYYMALVTYGHVFGRSPVGAWAPAGVDAVQARSLQTIAAEVVEAQRQRAGDERTPAQCAAYMRESFCGDYQRYMRVAYWSNPRSTYSRNFVSARLKEFKGAMTCRTAFGRDNGTNPFFYDREQDRSYWHAAP